MWWRSCFKLLEMRWIIYYIAWNNWKKNLDPCLTPYTKINVISIKGLKHKKRKWHQENNIEILKINLEVGRPLKYDTIPGSHKEKDDKFDYIKVKNFCHGKEYHKQTTSWHLLAPGKGVVFLICKGSSKSIRKRRNNPDAKLASKEYKQTVHKEGKANSSQTHEKMLNFAYERNAN